MNSMYSLSSMFLHMCNLLYDFVVIFIVLVCLLRLLARRVGRIGSLANFDSLLPDRDLTRKLHNKLYNMRNNNNNVLKIVRKVHQLYTSCTVQLVVGGPVTGELLYLSLWLSI